jgi:MFS family permease
VSLFSRLAKYDTFRSFKHRNYRLFYAGNLLSNTGSWIQRVAQDWLTLELTHSGTALGVVTALQFGPAILFSLHGGRLADRFSKRHLIIWTNLVSAATAAVIGMLVLTDTITINWLYLLALVSGIAGAIQAPIWQTFVHDLVGADDLPNAIALNSTNFNIGRLIGPAISGYLISILGTGPSFLLNAASFAFSITALAVMREHELFAALRPDADADGSIRAGLRYLRTRPDVITVLILIAMSGTFGLNYQMFMALMAKHEFNRAADSFGLLGSVMAIGSVSGALYVARRTERPTAGFVHTLVLVFGTVTMVASLAPTYAVYMAALPFCGFTALTMLSSANAYVQSTTEPEFRGRVMGVYMLVFIGGTPVGSLVVGWLAEAVSPRASMFVGGGIVVLVALITALVPMQRRVEVV